MPDERNIVRFPESGRERRKILRRSEDPRLRLVSILASACGWLFTLSLVMFLITNYRLLLPDSLQRIFSYLAAGLQTTSSDASTIEYASGTMNDAELFGGGLAYVDSDTLYVSKPNGIHQLSLQLPYSDPVVDASDSLILAYDRGGHGATLANALTPVCQVDLESPILSGAIGKNGGFAIVTDESGCKTAVTVFNNNGTQAFKWSTSQYYILSAALSPDGSWLALLAFEQQGVELESSLLFWKMGKQYDENAAPEAEYQLGSALGYEVRFLDASTAAAMTDRGAYLINRRGELEGQYEVPARDLLGYAFCDRGLLIVTSAYQGSARAEVRLLARNGGLSEEAIYIHSEIQHISAAGSVFGVLTAEGLRVYSVTAWNELWSDSSVSGARGLRMDSSGTAYVLYGGDCRIFRR
ncbi:MAG: hypothetical protein HFH27_03070 [Clostridiaceae bacterium]|nr:hypothetical protein [Clostridiaceae bacterium]NBH76863.1 hypothetical protein [Clostridiaceae bacterium]NBI82024.1 hypothetical protein [Clostridiaceae bacterium]